MPIEIVDYPDPLSEGSLRGRGRGTEPVLVESSASRVLRHELERYCRGRINGRSFLIAGHRGAGKTTLVAKAFSDIYRKSEDGAAMLRPLFISLHGPSLFPEPAEKPRPEAPANEPVQEGEKPPAEEAEEADPAKKKKKPASAQTTGTRPPDAEGAATAGKPAAESKREPKSEAQIALEQITLGLHRAVSREFAERFSARALLLASLRRKPLSAAKQLFELRDPRSGSVASWRTDWKGSIFRRPLAARAEWIKRRAAKAEFESKRPLDWRTENAIPDDAELQRLLAEIPEERELFEFAAQFETELYEVPAPHRLRENWNRLHALSGGVLFPGGFAPVASGISVTPVANLPSAMFPNISEVHEQGPRELTALSGVVEAYRRISGDYKKSEGEKSNASESEERVSGLDAGWKDIVPAVVAVLTGGLVTTGLAVRGAAPALTAFGGLAAAIGASLVFKVTKTRKRERSASREYQFIFDLSVATLDRTLPILIERLRNAGLAPVFIVDELDKVKDLSTRIISMVHHLKKLVAENAFFCFLTNRSYFEEMLAQGSDRAYPVEYTYYTHRLFVVFAPEDFERYLRQRIPDPPPASSVPSATPNPQASLDATARTMLRWALRHRAQLHVVDLQREIAALRDDASAVRRASDAILSDQRTLIDVTFQVGLELTLGHPRVEQVLIDQPEFRRLLHDAMYYISREWLSGEEKIDTSSDGRQKFVDYLERRTGRDEEKEPEKRRATDEKTEASKPSLSKRDIDFLFEQVGVLADFISDRPSLEPVTTDAGDVQMRDWRKQRLTDWNAERKKRGLPDVESDVQDILLAGERSSILERDSDREGVYRFRHGVAGTSRPEARKVAAPPPVVPATPGTTDSKGPTPGGVELLPIAPTPALSVEAWITQAAFIESFAGALARVTRFDQLPLTGPIASQVRQSVVTLDALSNRFRLISPSPTWSITQKAINNLRDASHRAAQYSGYSEDVFVVEQFYGTLNRNGGQIARAIVLGAVVGRAGSDKRDDQTIAIGMDVIARAMRFASKREDDVAKSLENVTAMVREAEGPAFEAPLNDLSACWPDVAEFEKKVGEALLIVRDMKPVTAASAVPFAWQSVQQRLAEWVKVGEVLDPDFEELLAAAGRKGPTQLIEFDPIEMTLHQWTRALLKARGGSKRPEFSTQQWLTFFAWHALGFRANGEHHVSVFARWAGVDWSLFRAGGAASSPELLNTFVLIHERTLLQGGESRESPNTLVMLRRGNSPMTAHWRPTPGTAALLMTGDELEELEKMADSNQMELPRGSFNVCALEMEPELHTKAFQEQLPALKRLLPESTIVYVHSKDPGRDTRLPKVVNPPDAENVVRSAIPLE